MLSSIASMNNTESLIDSRTSDAVALAIRFKCPIYTYEKIMAEAGMQMDEKAAAPNMFPLTKKSWNRDL